MKTKRMPPRNVDEYIGGFSPEVRSILEKIRATIREAAPDAEEIISYQIPAFTLKGILSILRLSRTTSGSTLQ